MVDNLYIPSHLYQFNFQIMISKNRLQPNGISVSISYKYAFLTFLTLKVPVRSNFPKFMFVDFAKLYVANTYQAKLFFNPSTGSPFFLMVFLVIFRSPLIGHVPTAQ